MCRVDTQPNRRVSRIIPNAVVRSKGDNSTYIGHELVKCRDFTSLRFRLPFEKVGSHHDHLSGAEDEDVAAVRVSWSTGMRRKPSGTGSSATSYGLVP